jgi:plastocyanin
MKRLAVLAIVSLLGLAGCSSDPSSEADSPSGGPNEEAPFALGDAPVETTEVTAVKSYKFDPAVIQVAVGDDVTWTNEDDFPHNIHFLTGPDETHDLPVGENVTVAFDDSGDFYYECSIHPQQMRGKVIVTD